MKRWKRIFSIFTQLRCFCCLTLLAGEWTPCCLFYDERNSTYDMLRKSYAKLKMLASKGIGGLPKQAQPISPQMESKLWQEKIFSRETGEALTNVAFLVQFKNVWT